MIFLDHLSIEAKHEIWNMKMTMANTKNMNIVGPICESSDFLGKNIKIMLKKMISWQLRTAGAYGFVMSSNYNSRPRLAKFL